MALAVLAAACGTGRATETPSGGAVRYIDVDGRTNRFNGSFLSYFPDNVSVRPGDVVVFRSVWTGEPHTVTMGTLVERALARSNVSALPHWTLGESQRLPANVGRPCYLSAGAPPKEPTQSCPVVAQPRFTGRQTYYSSGFLPENARFRVELDPAIAPGTYAFFCSFHGPRMSGAIRVVPKGEAATPQTELDAAAKLKLGGYVDSTLTVHAGKYKPFKRARSGHYPWPAIASFGADDDAVKVLEFVPFTLKAKVGERVSWKLNGAHTIAFDAPENAKPPAIRILSTGETEIKADAVNESRSPQVPVGAPTSPLTIEAPPYRRGFLSSGMLFSPAGQITYAMRFEKPGSYRYECLLHPRMTGLVIVST